MCFKERVLHGRLPAPGCRVAAGGRFPFARTLFPTCPCHRQSVLYCQQPQLLMMYTNMTDCFVCFNPVIIKSILIFTFWDARFSLFALSGKYLEIICFEHDEYVQVFVGQSKRYFYKWVSIKSSFNINWQEIKFNTLIPNRKSLSAFHQLYTHIRVPLQS